MYGKINIMNSLISRGYTSSGLIINIDNLSVDSSSTVASIQERGQEIGFD